MRKYMKSWLALGTAAMVAAGLTGCSGSKEAPATEAPKAEAATEAAADKTEAAAETTEEKKELEGELEIVTNANEQTYNAVNDHPVYDFRWTWVFLPFTLNPDQLPVLPEPERRLFRSSWALSVCDYHDPWYGCPPFPGEESGGA